MRNGSLQGRVGKLLVDGRDGVFIVVDLDMLLQFAILVPIFNLDEILETLNQ